MLLQYVHTHARFTHVTYHALDKLQTPFSIPPAGCLSADDIEADPGSPTKPRGGGAVRTVKERRAGEAQPVNK